MSNTTEEFVFYTPEYLQKARYNAKVEKYKKNINEFNELFKKVTEKVQQKINLKLLSYAQLNLNDEICSLIFLLMN